MKTKQEGVGLLEALIAFLVVGIGIAALIRLEGGYLQSSSEAKARTVALSLAQQKLDDIKGFTQIGSDATLFDYMDIADNAGGAVVDGALRLASGAVSSTLTPDSNVAYNLTWTVDDGYWVSGVLQYPTSGTPPKPVPDQKRITVTVTWVDSTNTTQTVSLQGIVAALDPENTDAIADASGTGGAGKPEVFYTPSTDEEVVAISTSTGDDTQKETLTPVASGGTTTMAAYTYKNDGGNNILLRTENFLTVACECRFNGTGDAYTAAHPKWSSSDDTFIDVEGEKVSKTIGCVQGGGSNCASNPDEYCDICCQNHHDTSSAEFKYDPYRGTGDFTSGDHNHYLTEGGSAVTSGGYVESCRLKMVNGYWRVYQDWHMVEHNIVPLESLDNSSNETSYAGFVQDVIDAYIDESKVSGQALTTPPSEPSVLSNSVTLAAVNNEKQLSGRAIYLDYMNSEHLTAIQQKKSSGSDYLLHVPFYELDISRLASWSSAIARGTGDKVDVGYYKKTGSGAYEIQAGQIRGMAATTGTPEAVTSQIKKSNSGLAAMESPDGVDFNTSVVNYDQEKHTDSINVCVADISGSCATTASTTTTTAPTTTTTASTTTTTAPTTTTTASTTTTTAPTTTTTASTTTTTAPTTTTTASTTTTTAPTTTTTASATTTTAPTTTTTLATCNTIISGKANNKNDSVSVNLNGTLFDTCSVNTNRDYSCPTIASGLSATISVTSSGSVDLTITVSPICGAKTINF